jgi:RNA polymerase sigma-70 factor (ECF subfamily)
MSDETEPARLLAEVHGAAFAWALTCCRWQRQEAEDVLHTAYVKVLDGSARWGGRASFKTWLFAVVRKTALGRQRVWLTWLRRRSDEDPASQPADAAAAPDEDGARVRTALAALARRQREVLDLVFYHDLTVEQAARVMGVSLGSARRHYARAKDNLAEKLR